MKVKSLHLSPVKSLRGLDVDTVNVEPRGLAGDRRWMLVDDKGVFITQREYPSLARITALPTATGLRLSADGQSIDIETPDTTASRIPVSIWKSNVEAYACKADTTTWFKTYFGINGHLVYQGDLKRTVPAGWSAHSDDTVSFADGFPLLITTTASLDDLQKRMANDMPMNRFRPNIVIDGAVPFDEDTWLTIQIGGIDIDIVKPCTRCVVTTTDQQSGVKPSAEPLATLKQFRLLREPNLTGVIFGQNAIARGTGVLRCGDSVKILSRQTAPAFLVKA